MVVWSIPVLRKVCRSKIPTWNMSSNQPNWIRNFQQKSIFVLQFNGSHSTSRCQTASSIRTLRSHQPVIPNVPFIRWAMVFSHKTTGSLRPTYIPARIVILTVKQTFAVTLCNKILFGFAFVLLRYSLGGDRPNQTTSHKLSNLFSKKKNLGWYYTGAKCSHLFYTKHFILQLKIIVKVYRVFPSNCK